MCGIVGYICIALWNHRVLSGVCRGWVVGSLSECLSCLVTVVSQISQRDDLLSFIHFLLFHAHYIIVSINFVPDFNVPSPKGLLEYCLLYAS